MKKNKNLSRNINRNLPTPVIKQEKQVVLEHIRSLLLNELFLLDLYPIRNSISDSVEELVQC